MLSGPEPKQVLSGAGADTIALAGHPTTVYSKSFSMKQMIASSLWLKAAGTSPRFDVDLEQSYTLPATEGSSDANWVVPEGNSPILNDVADTNAHISAQMSAAVMPFGRLKITSNAANGANTVITAILGIQQER
jgi:hypothetical protein